MPYVLFHTYCPEVAERETRSLTPLDPSFGLPPADYSFLEMFCDEPGCDCRRVFFQVVSSETGKTEAVIAWGWETAEFYARWMKRSTAEDIRQLQGPILNLCSPQTERAPALLRLVEKVLLRDEAYVERVKRHYKMFRGMVDGKTEHRGRKRRKTKRP